MDRQKQLIVASAALLVVVSTAVGLSSTEREEAPAGKDKLELAALGGEAGQKACASAAAYDRLKQVLFEDALKVRSSDPNNLHTLATHSVVRMENPVVKSRDEALNATSCSGTFILELPPGAEQGFGGQRRLIAEVDYVARAAADGSGLVYQLNGAEAIMARLADFNLQGGYTLPEQPETQFAEAAPSFPDSAMLGMGGPEEPVPADQDEDIQAETREAQEAREEREQERAERAERDREQRERREARVERARETERPTRRAEVRRPRGDARPSFNCRYARTRGERMVCENGRLAARDREMSAMFYSALRQADPRTRRQLQRTRDNFLAYRDRCRSEDCVADAYVGRMHEIEDIMAGR